MTFKLASPYNKVRIIIVQEMEEEGGVSDGTKQQQLREQFCSFKFQKRVEGGGSAK